jgi:hypothetical protein
VKISDDRASLLCKSPKDEIKPPDCRHRTPWYNILVVASLGNTQAPRKQDMTSGEGKKKNKEEKRTFHRHDANLIDSHANLIVFCRQ